MLISNRYERKKRRENVIKREELKKNEEEKMNKKPKKNPPKKMTKEKQKRVLGVHLCPNLNGPTILVDWIIISVLQIIFLNCSRREMEDCL